MASNVYGGLASGFHQVQAINPTPGLRVNSGDGGAARMFRYCGA